MNRIRKLGTIMLIALTGLSASGVNNVIYAVKGPELKLTTSPYNSGEYIRLEWDMEDKSQPYSYQLKKKIEGAEESQTIPAKDTVKVLNIYPEVEPRITYTTWGGKTVTTSAGGSAEMWMEEPNEDHPKGYGMGLIDVDPVEFYDFSDRPHEILKDENGDWIYDVIFFGTWDSNGGTGDISTEALGILKDFLDEGRGVLYGHDTPSYLRANLLSLRSYFNIKYGNNKTDKVDYDHVPWIASSKIKIKKQGLLTSYPHNIGEVGEVLDIPYTHTTHQVAFGDVWIDFTEHSGVHHQGEWFEDPITGLGTNDFYLTTLNNTAMIQTGHSNGKATSDEQKILANTLFYLSQITTDTSRDDRGTEDITAPDKPTIKSIKEVDLKTEIDLNPTIDNGTLYEYQVVATGRNDGRIIESNISEEVITSGFAGYSYVIDEIKDTIPDGKVNSIGQKIVYDGDMSKEKYLHIQAIDNEGNKSDVAHINLSEYVDKIPPELEIIPDTDEWVNDKVGLKISAQDKHSGIKEVFVTGEDQVKNGDFSEGAKHWRGGDGADPVYFNNGYVILNDSTKSRNKLNQHVFIDGISDSVHYVEVTARGEGILNARRGVDGGAPPKDNQVNVQDDTNFKTYQFIVEKYNRSNSSLVIERIGREGWLEISNVKVYEKRSVDNNSILDIHENGIFTFVAEDNSGNLTSKEVEISNIDKESPIINITQDITEDTHKDITLTIRASDNLSGIKKVTYIGENMIDNGDFSRGLENWSNHYYDNGSEIEGRIELKDGGILLASEVRLNKARQEDAFVGSAIGAEYYAEITARGNGTLNARYGAPTGGAQDNYSQKLTDENNFKVYRFKMERHDNNNNQFIMEKVGPEGWVEIKDVKVFASKEITDNKLVVTDNGTHTFVAEDNSGNITSKSYDVNNIVRELSFEVPNKTKNLEVILQSEMNLSTPIDNVKITDWRDGVNNWRLTLEANQLSSDSHVLPKGVMSLEGVNEIVKLDGNKSGSMSVLKDNKIIDDGPVQIINSTNERGIYEVKFKDEALKFNLSPNTVKKGTYSTELKWTLQSTPKAN